MFIFYFSSSFRKTDRQAECSLCLINLAFSNHQDLPKIKSIDRPILKQFKHITMLNLDKCALHPIVCAESGS